MLNPKIQESKNLSRGFLARLINIIINVLVTRVLKILFQSRSIVLLGYRLFMGHYFFNNNNKLCFISYIYIVYPEVIPIMNVQPIKGISTHLREA